jgi:protoporphyrinogen oxidase
LVRPRTPESSFKDWVVNRFGRELYETVFRTYTEKVWGMPCTEIDKDWAAQRIRALDLRRTLKDALLPRRAASVKTLIKSFIYPALGPGQLWEAVRDQIVEAGGAVLNGRCVMRVAHDQGAARFVETSDGTHHDATHFFSSMPLRDLIAALDPAPPPPVRSAAAHLRFRDFLTVALVIDRADVFPDKLDLRPRPYGAGGPDPELQELEPLDGGGPNSDLPRPRVLLQSRR